jgi:hypothetical protein
MTERFVAHVSKGKTLLLILGSLLFVALGLWFVIAPDTFADSVPWLGDAGLVQVIGGVAALFFGSCGVAAVRQLFRTDPVIEMGPEGLLWRRWSKEAIPWDAFERAAIGQIQRQRMLTFWLRDPDAYRSTSFSGRTAGANKALGFGDITPSTAGLDRSVDELADAAHRFAPQLFGR